MSFRFKKGKGGAKVKGLKPEMDHAIRVAREVYQQYGYDCVLTGGTEEGHKTIVHPLGYAVDFRTRHLSAVAKNEVASTMADRLTDEYQVLLKEDPPHIHVEFDPRKRSV